MAGRDPGRTRRARGLWGWDARWADSTANQGVRTIGTRRFDWDW